MQKIIIALLLFISFVFGISKEFSKIEQFSTYLSWDNAAIKNAKPIDMPVIFPEFFKNRESPLSHTRELEPEKVGEYPYKTTGRLLFRSAAGNHSCTASSVGFNLVATAGHCVAKGDNKEWYRDLLFIPQFRDDTAPKGKWPAIKVWTTKEWFQRGYLGRDVAFFLVGKNEKGQTLDEVVDKLTPIFNQGRNFATELLGYPKNIGNLQRMIISVGKIEPGSSQYRPATMSSQSRMTFGASGGPWIVNGRNLYGINSYISGLKPNYIFSSFFDEEIEKLYEQAKKEQ